MEIPIKTKNDLIKAINEHRPNKIYTVGNDGLEIFYTQLKYLTDDKTGEKFIYNKYFTDHHGYLQPLDIFINSVSLEFSLEKKKVVIII